MNIRVSKKKTTKLSAPGNFFFPEDISRRNVNSMLNGNLFVENLPGFSIFCFFGLWFLGINFAPYFLKQCIIQPLDQVSMFHIT